jgi:hypothetical protein
MAALVVLVALLPVGAASPYTPGDPFSWSNGTVLCQFAAASPLVAVSALDLASSGLSASVVGLEEVHANGTVAAVADLNAGTWSVANLSTDDAYDLGMWTESPVDLPGTGTGEVGTVNLSVQFVLPIYDAPTAAALDQVSVIFAESGWPWQAPGDVQVLTLGGAPSYPSTEHLGPSTESGWILSSFADPSGAERERLGTNSTALVATPGSAPTTIAATSSLDLASSQWATVAVSFASSAGEFSNLTFTARVGIVLPTTIAGIPLVDFAAAAGAATLVSLGVAWSARRLRRRPSRLIYVEDDP